MNVGYIAPIRVSCRGCMIYKSELTIWFLRWMKTVSMMIEVGGYFVHIVTAEEIWMFSHLINLKKRPCQLIHFHIMASY